MPKVREDAWTKEDDKVLANTVLNTIASGETQLKAFEIAGEKLERTASACGYRWNAVIRDQHRKELSQLRKAKVKGLHSKPELEVVSEIKEPIKAIERVVEKATPKKETEVLGVYGSMIQIIKEYAVLEHKYEELLKQHEELKQRLVN